MKSACSVGMGVEEGGAPLTVQSLRAHLCNTISIFKGSLGRRWPFLFVCRGRRLRLVFYFYSSEPHRLQLFNKSNLKCIFFPTLIHYSPLLNSHPGWWDAAEGRGFNWTKPGRGSPRVAPAGLRLTGVRWFTKPRRRSGTTLESASVSGVKSVMRQRVVAQLIAIHRMREQGQRGSPRGNIEKETCYIVIHNGCTTWEMLSADSDSSVRLSLHIM